MNFRQLEQFLAVAETGSFSRGAARAHVSQPALSTAIAKLEGDLCVQLFNRQARQVTLTAEGYQLMSSAKRIVGECEAVRSALKKTAEQETLAIGICETLDLPAIAALLEQFRRIHGTIRLKVLELPSGALIERLQAGRLDLTYLVRTGDETIPAQLAERPLNTEKYVIAASKDHRLAGQRSAPLSVLNDLPFIARNHCEYRTIIKQLWSEQSIRPKVVYQTAQDQRALELVRAGLGVGIFPESLVADDLAIVDIEDHSLSRRISCVWKRESQTEAVTAFLRFSQLENEPEEATP
ncbi:LysR family transcriptional regulator [Cobetia sp. 1CM21F]|uniref:LysR family transcriptional regulator n=1 Tax=Cobetia sp. 1CM21F TaxID=2929163 RepID=UPI0020C01E9C|nr:LysR family transcriptional regulator [Cobetia sp. 1CM21F]MCK8067691.1 LysR family transcriptional regulator [Cobetia sp. 1CM21F]